MSDGNEAVHPDGKPMPGAVPADRPNAPVSRSLQHPKPEAGEVPTAKKATGSRKKAPEAASSSLICHRSAYGVTQAASDRARITGASLLKIGECTNLCSSYPPSAFCTPRGSS